MSGSLALVGEADFDEVVLRSPVPVLVDFFTQWCVPCKQLAPTLEDLAAEYGETLSIVSVDAEASPALAKSYGVTGYPTMVLVQDGEEVARPRARTRMQLRAEIDAARGVTTASTVSVAEEAPLAPEVQRILERLDALDEAAWMQVEATVGTLFGVETEMVVGARALDEEALVGVQARLKSDVEELAAARFGAATAVAIASGVEAAFDYWVRAGAPGPGFKGAFRAVPAARMSPYLPDGEAPADVAAAAADYLARMTALTDDEWVQVRAVNRDLWPYAERMQGQRLSAWLAAVILLQATVSADLLPADVLDACWEPFAGVLERHEVEAA